MDAEKMVSNFMRINDNFYEVEKGIKKLSKALRKSQKKLKWTRVGVAFLAIYCAGLAIELAERKRSENYLQEQIDKLKEEVDYGKCVGCEIDGGSADA